MMSLLVIATLAIGTPDWAECRIGQLPGPVMDAECITLTVPENHAEPDGAAIELKIARLKAMARKPAEAPMVFIAGGPGQSSIDHFPSVSGGFRGVRRQRDILLVDQRGTGASHPLQCESPDEDPLEQPDTFDKSAAIEWTRACLESLQGDIRYFTTQDAIADLDLVRRELGYPKLALYGISYGTRVAQEYLRRYPESVHAVVLDGVTSPNEALGTEMAGDAQAALDQLLARCAASPSCNLRYPDLANDLRKIREQLDDDGLMVRFADPRTMEMRNEIMTWPRFAMLLRMSSYGTESASILPKLINDAANGDWDVVAANTAEQARELNQMINIGMHNAVVCSEDIPWFPENPPATDAYLGDSVATVLQTMCSVWPTRELPDDIKQPVSSDLPVLLLSGEHDPVTPPSNAEEAMVNLSNSLHLVARGQGHGVAWRGCMPRIVADFYQSASVTDLGTDCLDDFVADRIFLNSNSPDFKGDDHAED